MAVGTRQVLGSILTPPSGHQRIHLRPRLLNSEFRFESPDHIKEVTAPVAGVRGIELQRLPDFRRIVAARRKRVTGRHHTDDRRRLRIDLNLSSNYVFLFAERAAPEAI